MSMELLEALEAEEPMVMGFDLHSWGIDVDEPVVLTVSWDALTLPVDEPPLDHADISTFDELSAGSGAFGDEDGASVDGRSGDATTCGDTEVGTGSDDSSSAPSGGDHEAGFPTGEDGRSTTSSTGR
jgi:hypothetical protein